MLRNSDTFYEFKEFVIKYFFIIIIILFDCPRKPHFLLLFLSYQVNLDMCRGQSNDSASNMLGK